MDVPSPTALSGHFIDLEQIIRNYSTEEVVSKIQTIVLNFKTDASAAVNGSTSFVQH